jgi:hypothetical protein
MVQERSIGQTEAIVDTNILVVYVTGLVDPSLIGRTKRTKEYSPDDFTALDAILGEFRRIVTFPNIMTEVSSLLEKSDRHVKYRIFERLYELFDVLDEQYFESASLPFCHDSLILGITDQVILESVDRSLVLLSDDFELSSRYQSRGGEAINFNHIRDSYISND